MGVRVLVGPDVPDEALRSTDHHQEWVPVKSFKNGVAQRVELKITDRLYLCWRRCCRTYTLRGRVVCRRLVWDPIEQQMVVCDAPVRGAEVTASDVDRFWWWSRRDKVGSDFTDINGNFEIKFTWCCWWWRPWFFKNWQLEPELVDRIRELFERIRFPEPIPRPDPVPDFSIFERLVTDNASALPVQTVGATDMDIDGSHFIRLGEELAAQLPEAPDLRSLHVWPWYPILDCKPDIVFKVTQDCGEGDVTIYTESSTKTRWNIPTELNGITLEANENACCGPFCCADPPDDDCLAIHGVGCYTSYPIEHIEQNLTDPLAGYAFPGIHDRPFGGTIWIRGVFGDGSEVDYYKPQRRRISSSPTGWEDLPEEEIAVFKRGHWIGPPPPYHQYETVKSLDVGTENVLKTISRYREEHPGVSTTVDPGNGDVLLRWKTANDESNSGAPMAGLVDGIYELRFVGYRYDAASDNLVAPQVMPLCAAPGEEIDPAEHATIVLRLDNRTWSINPGSIHLATSEPDCDFPNICAVVVNENPSLPLSLQKDKCVDACGIARVKAGDTITVHFSAKDSDGHLDSYRMTGHWAESSVFNVLAAGTLAGDNDPLCGPTYAQTFLGSQGIFRTTLPPADPEHDRPIWYGGNFKVTVEVGDTAFETCCAYLLRLRVWKRTTNGCTGPYHFHANWCEFSFTVIREDLIGHPDHPSCSELCPSDKVKADKIVEAEEKK